MVNKEQTQGISKLWALDKPKVEVDWLGPAKIAGSGQVLFTDGLGGCTALIIRAVLANNEPLGLLSHRVTYKETTPVVLCEVVNRIPQNVRLSGVVLYPLDNDGQSLGPDVETIAEDYLAGLETQFNGHWDSLNKRGYSKISGVEIKTNNNRLVFDVESGNWAFREPSDETVGKKYAYSGSLVTLSKKLN